MGYISTIEAKKYPFVGVQFHPEKNIFEWATNTVGNIPHNKHAVSIALYFSTYFINMARRSHHSFPTREIEEKNLIYNFDPKYVGKRYKLDFSASLFVSLKCFIYKIRWQNKLK